MSFAVSFASSLSASLAFGFLIWALAHQLSPLFSIFDFRRQFFGSRGERRGLRCVAAMNSCVYSSFAFHKWDAPWNGDSGRERERERNLMAFFPRLMDWCIRFRRILRCIAFLRLISTVFALPKTIRTRVRRKVPQFLFSCFFIQHGFVCLLRNSFRITCTTFDSRKGLQFSQLSTSATVGNIHPSAPGSCLDSLPWHAAASGEIVRIKHTSRLLKSEFEPAFGRRLFMEMVNWMYFSVEVGKNGRMTLLSVNALQAINTDFVV